MPSKASEIVLVYDDLAPVDADEFLFPTQPCSFIPMEYVIHSTFMVSYTNSVCRISIFPGSLGTPKAIIQFRNLR